MTEKNYNDLIGEAFIDPIRSVLIVDDDYPTFHEILQDDPILLQKFAHKDWNKKAENRAKVRKVIEEFRRPEAPYLLDIHDGTSPSEETDEQQVHILHQTDLLILDYQLEKSREGDGSKAVRIARQALANKHFNLILVHTQESLERVFHEFLVGFSMPALSQCEIEVGNKLQEFLNSQEDALLAAVRDRQYNWAIRSGRENLRKALHKGEAPWGDTKALFEKANLARSEWLTAVYHALQIFEQDNAERLASENLGVTFWNDGEVKFIRAARGFIAFKSKDDDKELLPAIQKALIAWNPRPPRLMLTKLRAEMNERGIEVQDDALGDPDIGAIWYHRLLEAGAQNLDAIVTGTVRNYAEQLLDKLLPNVTSFAKDIISVDRKRGALEAVKGHFSVDLSDAEVLTTAKMGHNAFVGSKPVRSVHLELGHILRIEDIYWLCLTPACDMVPKVHRGKPSDRMEGIKRFTALKLVPQKPADAIANANRGGQIFANITSPGGEAKRLAFSAAVAPGASPAWMMMYVQNDGYLPNEDAPRCRVSYVSAPKTKRAKFPKIKTIEATVCGMLRYEYALEIQSRFIASQSRIGLDFVSAGDQQVEVDEAAGQ
ncbi:hypothetical protein CO659_05215 [Rhizobium sp. S9]|uniref:response regulator receiver domain n=1 Tax=unclassified Rhizobium TaxID=2613769 RepID=UPI000A210FC3|nr:MULTISPECIES: response regulator receiver domain [unclassified Rhizobium]ARO27280.1 hypothetical protein TAL182_PD00188 [Rhizobium sp. TAL182]PDS98984.1 hypothetical protein CO659_05215 [Rhizobium sp. S9]